MIIGFLIFLVLNAILLAWYNVYLGIFSLMYTFFSAIIWESIENSIFHHYGIKFAQRRDSFINCLMDICFFSFGGFIALVFSHFGGIFFVINTLIFLNLIFLLTSLYLAKILDIKKIVKNIFKPKSNS